MNPHPPPLPSPHFIFNPPYVNPNPNTDPSMLPSHSQINSSHLHHPPPLPSDLPTTLSFLDDLLRLSQSTLDHLSSIVPSLSATERIGHASSNALSQCPSNPNHFMPPEHLFLHSLKCPFQLDVGHLLEALHYPKTLKSEDQLILQNKFNQLLEDPNEELCFSLEDYMAFDSNFFYQDCPGVVKLLSGDNMKRMFSLPGVLAVGCANFGGRSDGEINGLLMEHVRLLPSEVWSVRHGVYQWSDFPYEYSYSILRVFLGLDFVKESDLLTWVISNSPSFGIVIDVFMRDHILVLLRLCLKAVMREAARSSEFVLKRGAYENNCEMSMNKGTFKCPVLVHAFKWFASQLSILYGIECAKSFAMAMLKNLILNAASNLLLWHDDQELASASGIDLESVKVDANNVADHTTAEFIKARAGICSKPIFVYQIGAAIASFYERSLLEERLRVLWDPKPFTAYQRAAEHAYWSKFAEDERKRHPKYRPLLEQDSLPLQSSHDLETIGKTKTREELLAEERDYKRRRMSYRGKKLKRTPKEVLRDIIEEHMEAITEAGGIGFSVKEEGGKVLTSEPVPGYDFPGGAGSRAGSFEVDKTRVGQQHSYEKQLPVGSNRKNTKLRDSSPGLHYARRKEQSHKHNIGFENRRRMSGDGYDRKYPSASPDNGGSDDMLREHGSYSHESSKEWQSRGREHDIRDVAEDRHYRREHFSSTQSEYCDSRYHSSTSRSQNVSSRRKDRQGSDASCRRTHRIRHENDGSGWPTRDDFSDRYDPSKSQDADDYQLLSHS